MKCHTVDYEIIGNSMPMLEVELDPGETVIAEAGSMNYMEQDIGFETKMGDGADPEQGMLSKLFSAGKRMITGESLFMTHFSNNGGQKRKVAFAAPYPGMVVPIDMSQIGERLYCQKDAFLCAALGTRLSVAFSRKLGAGFFGGEGFILQKLEGDGMAFIQAGGTVVRKELNNETLRIDTGCLVGFGQGIEYDIEMVKGLKSMFLGGEGLWLTTLSGTGTVWVQSLPFSRLADRIIAAAPAVGGDKKGES
ncbi:TIGR00266 family protein [Amphritea sp.]|uniref:TIGR00266 family protein n=1 Tax=Amphritea sp. TaxID=1872502 RepID=UPI003D101E14